MEIFWGGDMNQTGRLVITSTGMFKSTMLRCQKFLYWKVTGSLPFIQKPVPSQTFWVTTLVWFWKWKSSTNVKRWHFRALNGGPATCISPGMILAMETMFLVTLLIRRLTPNHTWQTCRFSAWVPTGLNWQSQAFSGEIPSVKSKHFASLKN